MFRTKLRGFDARLVGIFSLMVLLLFIGGARVIKINLSGYRETAESQGQMNLNVYHHRGTIFDRNFNPLTNIPGKITAAVTATPASLVALQDNLSHTDYTSLRQRLSGRKPILLTLKNPITAEGITLIDSYTRYSGLAPHIIGYTDSEFHGAAGVEASFDSLLYSPKVTTVTFGTDALGGALSGIDPIVGSKENTAVRDGVVLTLDRKIQKIVEEESEVLGKGAVVVLEPKSGDILAMHSLPTYNQDSPSDSLDGEDSPFLNRALSLYNAGSIFKSCIALAALEKYPDMPQFQCNGSLQIGETVFACNKAEGHGRIDFYSAMAKSCNVYFYNLALGLKAEALYSAACSLGFGEAIPLCRGISAEKSILPNESLLKNTPAAVGNFAIGQGDIMVSPLSIAAAYNSFANDGVYHSPRLVYGIISREKFSPAAMSNGVRIMQPQTAEKLKKALTLVVTDGTGVSAAPHNCTAAGKTATAQTGWMQDGHLVTQSWFAGFFPAEKPRFTLVVLKESGSSGSADCAPIFQKIAQRICDEFLI